MKNGKIVVTPTVGEGECSNGDGEGVGEGESSFALTAVDDDIGLHHCLLRSCNPLPLSSQCQIINFTDPHNLLSAQLVLSLQEDELCVGGEVVVRLRDVVGEVTAGLVWWTGLATISHHIVNCTDCSGEWYSSKQQ